MQIGEKETTYGLYNTIPKQVKVMAIITYIKHCASIQTGLWSKPAHEKCG